MSLQPLKIQIKIYIFPGTDKLMVQAVVGAHFYQYFGFGVEHTHIYILLMKPFLLAGFDNFFLCFFFCYFQLLAF